MTATRTALLAYADALSVVVDLSRTLIDGNAQATPKPDHSHCETVFNAARSEAEKARKRAIELSEEKAAAGKKAIALEAEIGARNTQIDKLIETSEVKSARIKDLEAQLERAHTDLWDVEKASPAVPTDDAATLDELKQEKAALASRVQASELELDKAKGELQQLRVDLAQAGEMHGKITAERDQLAQNLESEKLARDIEAVNDTSKKLMDAVYEDHADAPAPGKEESERAEPLEAEIKVLRGLNDEQKREMRIVRGQLKTMEAKVADLHAARDEAISERDAAREEATTLRGQADGPSANTALQARAVVKRAHKRLTAANDVYDFETDDPVALMLTEAADLLSKKEK